MTRLIFLGPPGAGKGTQAVSLSKQCSVPHVSTGDILRAAVSNQTALGKQAKSYMSAGELVPDELILNLIRERLQQADANSGWILDGFPRNVAQANFLEELLKEITQPCEAVLNLEVPDEVIVTRLVSRGRNDDKEDVIRHRLTVYHQQTAPLIDFYRNRQLLISVDGNRPMDEVSGELEKIVQS